MSLLLVLVATLALLTWLLREPLFAEWRRARVRRQPFPPEWRRILRERVPYFHTLPADLQLQLKKKMQVFLAEKPIIGCAGLEVTDEMRVTIAAQACLLILNRRTDHFADLRQVLLYPGAFVVDKLRTDGVGVAHERRHALAGESWSTGQVILSSEDTLDGARVPDDGRNVVIHEFAHQLDQANGPANGAPYLPTRARRARWSAVFNAEFEALQARVERGEPSLLDAYGASDAAEFFAVATEAFFEQPQRMAQEHAALFREMSSLYRVNPLSW
ncbi:MAG: M90 family metallopeptidase [Pseudomonadota bacterium]